MIIEIARIYYLNLILIRTLDKSTSSPKLNRVN